MAKCATRVSHGATRLVEPRISASARQKATQRTGYDEAVSLRHNSKGIISVIQFGSRALGRSFSERCIRGSDNSRRNQRTIRPRKNIIYRSREDEKTAEGKEGKRMTKRERVHRGVEGER